MARKRIFNVGVDGASFSMSVMSVSRPPCTIGQIVVGNSSYLRPCLDFGFQNDLIKTTSQNIFGENIGPCLALNLPWPTSVIEQGASREMEG